MGRELTITKYWSKKQKNLPSDIPKRDDRRRKNKTKKNHG